MIVTNKTMRPLRLPLPGDKTLFLAPGGTAQIAPKAKQHPPLMEFVESGQVELDDGAHSSGTTGSPKGGDLRSSGRHDAGGGIRRTGDR